MRKRIAPVARGVFALCAVAALVLAGWLGHDNNALAEENDVAAPKMKNIEGIEELKGLFVADKGKPRLVLLLSPT